MGPRDILHFDDKAYATKLKNNRDSRNLRKEHHSKIRLRQASAFSVVWGIGLAPATLGVSLVGSIYSSRQIHVFNQQAKLIEIELTSRDCAPRRRKRDLVYGVLIGAAGVCIGMGIGDFFSHLIEPVSGGLASATRTPRIDEVPSLMDTAQLAASDVSSAAHGAIQGANHVLSTELHHINHDTNASADAASVPPGGNATYRAGEQLGVTGIEVGQKVAGV